VPLLVIPPLTTLLAMGLVGLVLVAQRQSFWGMLARVHYTRWPLPPCCSQPG